MSENVRPFVKWAGGKGSLTSQLNKFYPYELKNGTIEKYIEPFLGGGAILIDILQKFNVNKAYAFDINIDLINSYNIIKNDVNNLIIELGKMETEYLQLGQEERTKYYYNTRDEYNSYKLNEKENSIKKAAQFIYLNRTCFNGLYRVNKSGDFNVPIGKYKNPKICDEQNLMRLSELIQNVEFRYGDYTKSIKYININTFVYFDPPYRPLNKISGFTSYTKEYFNDNNQRELAKYFATLNNMGAKVMLSNSNPKNTNKDDTFFDEIYNEFNINKIYAKRMINANSKGRGAISEIVVTNYSV